MHHRWRARATAATVLATGALTAAVSGASAAPAWLAQPDLTAAGTSASVPDVAMNGAGDSIVAWQRAGDFLVQASHRPGGAGFSAPVGLGSAGLDAFGTPQAAIDGDGDAVVVWQEPDGSGLNTVVRAATRPAGGSFGAALRLSRSGSVAAHPRVEMNVAGDTVVVWEYVVGQSIVVQAAVRPAGGTFSAPLTVSAAGLMGPLPRAAIDGAGNVTVVWQQTGPDSAIAQAATRPAGGTFSAPVGLSAPGNVSGAQVASNAAGETVAAWARVDSTPSWVVQAATRSARGSFSAPADLSAVGHDGVDPHVGIDAAGNAVAVWTRYDGISHVVQVARCPAGHACGTASNLSLAGGEARVPQLAVDPAGDAVVAWQRSDGTNTIVQATAARAGAGFAAPSSLSPAGRDALGPKVGIDDAGDAIVGWQRSDGANTIVQAAGYDPAAPQLRAVSVPGTVTAATAASFSLSALDVWSPVSTLWSFDDAATAAGASVSHAFAATGDHVVTVTATDALGNAASATRTVTVLPGPPPGTAPAPRPPAAPAPSSGVTAAPAPSNRFTAAPAPSNRFTATVTKARAGGVIRLVLRAQAAGDYRAVGTRRLSRTRTSAYGRGRATAARPGRVTLTIRPTRGARRRLTARGARVAVLVTFTPTGGTRRNKRLTVVVKR